MLSGLAVVTALLGTIFALQGLGVPIGHGFMVGDLRWTVIGLVLVGAVAALAWRSRRP
jgi:hypothetical protein